MGAAKVGLQIVERTEQVDRRLARDSAAGLAADHLAQVAARVCVATSPLRQRLDGVHVARDEIEAGVDIYVARQLRR